MVPKYMQKGSKGPHVTILQAFLCGAGASLDIKFDQEYGNVTAAAVAEFQTTNGFEVDGNFGPATRDAAKNNFGFDFEAACETVNGVTEFVQPDGSVERWWPGAPTRHAVGLDLPGEQLGFRTT